VERRHLRRQAAKMINLVAEQLGELPTRSKSRSTGVPCSITVVEGVDMQQVLGLNTGRTSHTSGRAGVDGVAVVHGVPDVDVVREQPVKDQVPTTDPPVAAPAVPEVSTAPVAPASHPAPAPPPVSQDVAQSAEALAQKPEAIFIVRDPSTRSNSSTASSRARGPVHRGPSREEDAKRKRYRS
jgi:hypothetical protein